MKESIHELGVKGIYADDLLVYNESMRALEQLLEPYGDYIISGCEVKNGNLNGGYCFLDGKIRRVPSHSNIVLPAYIVPHDITEGTREYRTGGTKPAFNVYGAKVVNTKPTNGDYIYINYDGTLMRWQEAVGILGKLNSADFEVKKALDVVGFQNKSLMYTDSNDNVNFIPLAEEATDNYKMCKKTSNQRLNINSTTVLNLDIDKGNDTDFKRESNGVKVLTDISFIDIEISGSYKGNNVNVGRELDITAEVYINNIPTEIFTSITLDNSTNKLVNHVFSRIKVAKQDLISIVIKVGNGKDIQSLDVLKGFTFIIKNLHKKGVIKIPDEFIKNKEEVFNSDSLEIMQNDGGVIDFNDEKFLNKNVRYDVYDTAGGDAIINRKFINAPYEIIHSDLIIKELQEGRLRKNIRLVYENKYNSITGHNYKTLEIIFNNFYIKWKMIGIQSWVYQNMNFNFRNYTTITYNRGTGYNGKEATFEFFFTPKELWHTGICSGDAVRGNYLLNTKGFYMYKQMNLPYTNIPELNIFASFGEENDRIKIHRNGLLSLRCINILYCKNASFLIKINT